MESSSLNLVELLDILRTAKDWGSRARTALEECENQINGAYMLIARHLQDQQQIHGQVPDPESFTAPVTHAGNSNSFSGITSSPLLISFEHLELEREQLPELPADDATSEEGGIFNMSPAILLESIMNGINMSNEEKKIHEEVPTARKSPGKGDSLNMEGERARQNENSNEEITLKSLVKMEAKAVARTADKKKSETPIWRIAKVLKISTREKPQGAKKRPHRNDDSESEVPLKRPRPKNMLLESFSGTMGFAVSFPGGKSGCIVMYNRLCIKG